MTRQAPVNTEVEEGSRDWGETEITERGTDNEWETTERDGEEEREKEKQKERDPGMSPSLRQKTLSRRPIKGEANPQVAVSP